jgi:phosphoglycerate-specific signal transduction histidine kinase
MKTGIIIIIIIWETKNDKQKNKKIENVFKVYVRSKAIYIKQFFINMNVNAADTTNNAMSNHFE